MNFTADVFLGNVDKSTSFCTHSLIHSIAAFVLNRQLSFSLIYLGKIAQIVRTLSWYGSLPFNCMFSPTVLIKLPSKPFDVRSTSNTPQFEYPKNRTTRPTKCKKSIKPNVFYIHLWIGVFFSINCFFNWQTFQISLQIWMNCVVKKIAGSCHSLCVNVYELCCGSEMSNMLIFFLKLFCCLLLHRLCSRID